MQLLPSDRVLRKPLWYVLSATSLLGLSLLAGCGGGGSNNDSSISSAPAGLPGTTATLAQVDQGRAIVTSFGCVDCHSGGINTPSNPYWLSGYNPNLSTNQGVFQIGPGSVYAANLTPDTTTGIGSYTDLQIYNALKFGLDPAVTPSAAITSTGSDPVPGQNGFPASPQYLAPPMPWTSTRHLTDPQIWSVVAYLKHGIKPVSNAVPASESALDHHGWATFYTDAASGPTALPGYPAGNEQFTP